MSRKTCKKSFKFHWFHGIVVLFSILLLLGAPIAYVHAQKAQVDLNNASQKELEALKGVGPATAKKIIAGRPYKSVDELSKAGLSTKQIEALKPFVTVGSAAPAPALPDDQSPCGDKNSCNAKACCRERGDGLGRFEHRFGEGTRGA